MCELKTLLYQTAEDYDIPMWLVEKTYKEDKDNFYEKLEELLVERRKK